MPDVEVSVPFLSGGNGPRRSNPTFSNGMSTSVLVNVLPSVQRVVGWLVIWAFAWSGDAKKLSSNDSFGGKTSPNPLNLAKLSAFFCIGSA
jgi:hypothetical protein